MLSDPRQRAAYDARRYLPRADQHASRSRSAARAARRGRGRASPTRRRRCSVASTASWPCSGILLLIGIGFYVVNVIPYAEQQIQVDGVAASPPDVGADARGRALDRHPASARPCPSACATTRPAAASRARCSSRPSNLEPFASLPIVRIDATSQGIARYAVYYGDLTTGGATISGLVGRVVVRRRARRASPDCAPDATYCAGPAPGQTAGPPGLELFRAPDLVERLPGVRHPSRVLQRRVLVAELVRAARPT